jgi:hypothetical protein
VNATKGERSIGFDPFTLEPGLFALEFHQYQVVPGPAASADQARQVEETSRILGLNLPDCRKLREKYVADYRLGAPDGIEFPNLERRAPFIAQELQRQGMLVRGDS